MDLDVGGLVGIAGGVAFVGVWPSCPGSPGTVDLLCQITHNLAPQYLAPGLRDGREVRINVVQRADRLWLVSVRRSAQIEVTREVSGTKIVVVQIDDHGHEFAVEMSDQEAADWRAAGAGGVMVVCMAGPPQGNQIDCLLGYDVYVPPENIDVRPLVSRGR